jgi:tRNA(fMet)-specific endonuclease VapC
MAGADRAAEEQADREEERSVRVTLFMLDTDSVSLALRGEGRVGQRLLQHRPSAICLSSVTVAELRYGAARRKSARLHELIDAFAANIAVLPFDEAAANTFGVIAAELSLAGTPIGDFDVLIAAHAISADATLVTNNTRHFQRVAGLTIDNWA